MILEKCRGKKGWGKFVQEIAGMGK